MLIFESYQKKQELKERISNNEHFFIVLDKLQDALDIEKILFKSDYKRYESYYYGRRDEPSQYNYELEDQLIGMEITPVSKSIGYRNFPKYHLENDRISNLFHFWNTGKDYILNALGINTSPHYRPKQFIYESDENRLSYLKKAKNLNESIFIVPSTKEDAIEIQKILDNETNINFQYEGQFSKDYIKYHEYGNDNDLVLFFIFYNDEKPFYSYFRVSKNDLKNSNIKPNVIYYPKDKELLNRFLNNKPSYQPRQFVYESNEYGNIGVLCDTRDKCIDFENFLHKNGLSYSNGSEYIVSNGDFNHLLFIKFNKKDKTFSATGSDTHSTCDVIYNYPEDNGSILKFLNRFLNNKPSYQPKKLIYESNNNKILYAFDMDDTLVYSKRFEEHIKPLLVREYLTPEIIFNNKLEDIGVGLEKLKYENGRIYFDDPHEDYEIPKSSSWVRKKGRIYIIQPDAYFMTDESMPIGTYDDIVSLYNNAEYKCIITARNERLRSQTLKVLKNLGIQKPNIGLFMYPINSFSYTYEYKSNKLLELYKLYDFNEIHYFDDNIKLLKKIKQNLQGKDINIKYFKVTKNRYRQL